MDTSGRSTGMGIVLMIIGVVAYIWLRGQRADEWFQVLLGLFLIYYWYSNRQSATPWTVGLGVALTIDQLEELFRGVTYLQGDALYLWPAAVVIAGLAYLFVAGSGGQRRTTLGAVLVIVGIVWHYFNATGHPVVALIVPILIGLYVLYDWNQLRGRGVSDPFAFGWGLMMVLGPLAWSAGMRDLFPGLFLAAAGIAVFIPRPTVSQAA